MLQVVLRLVYMDTHSCVLEYMDTFMYTSTLMDTLHMTYVVVVFFK